MQQILIDSINNEMGSFKAQHKQLNCTNLEFDIAFLRTSSLYLDWKCMPKAIW